MATYVGGVDRLHGDVLWLVGQGLNAIGDAEEDRLGVLMTDGMIERLLQRVPPGARRLTQLRHILALAARQVIASIGQTSVDVRHVVVAQGVHVRLRLVADHGVEAAQRAAQNRNTLRLAALVERLVRKVVGCSGRRRRLIGNVASCGRGRWLGDVRPKSFEDVGKCSFHAHHHHTSFVHLRVRVHLTPIDSRVL